MSEQVDIKYENRGLVVKVCHLCFATDRKLQDVDKAVLLAFGLLTDWMPIQGVLICWECRKRLSNIQQFKQQVKTAREYMQAFMKGQISLPNSLSSLKGCTENYFHYSEIQLKTNEVKKYENTGDQYDCVVWAEPITENSLIKTVRTPLIKEQINVKIIGDETYDEGNTNSGSDPLDCDDDVIFICENKNDVIALQNDDLLKNQENDFKFEIDKIDGNKTFQSAKQKPNRSQLDKCYDVKEHFESYFPTKEEHEQYLEDYFKARKSKYNCVNCVTSLPNVQALQTHNLKFHFDAQGAFKCDECSCSFSSLERLTFHKSKHTTFCLYRCLVAGCSYIVHSRNLLVQHIRRHEKIEKDKYHTDKYECDHCGKVYDSRKKIFIHIRRLQRKMVCEVCGYKARVQCNLNKHMLSHLGPEHRRYCCDTCNKRFNDKFKLIVHMRVHSGERFYCGLCSSKFLDKHLLKRHYNIKHPHQLTDEHIIKKRSYIPRVKPFYNSRHKKCPDKAVKEGPYVCDVCNKEFKLKSRLGLHMVVHSDERPYACTVCNKRFKNKLNLKVHIDSHSEKRNYKCDICNAAFKQHAHLYCHKVLHTGEKPHMCPTCGAKFATKVNFSAHMKIHSGHKPHQCSVCSKKFIWRKDLVLHSTRMHPGIEIPTCQK